VLLSHEPRSVFVTRLVRVGATLVVLALAFAYILLKIDVHKTAQILRGASLGWVAASILLILAGVVPMARRWQVLLRARGVDESLAWLTRAYFVSLAVGQVLPTSIGGDASRIYEATRRHRGEVSVIAGSVLVERAIGGVSTLVLAGVGFLLAIGRYPIGSYLWIELLVVLAAVVLGFVFFSRAARARLVMVVPITRRLRIERLARAVYEGVHAYRDHRRALGFVSVATLLVQFGGILSIYAAGRAVGIHVSLLAYVVLGPLLFLVTLIPFTINGLGVREAFFVNFFARLHIPADAAFACGFLFFLTSLTLALPGLGVIFRVGLRREPAPDVVV
jgi:uncharacterized protein (TIRG00374 family)